MATHSSVLAWRILWTEKLGRLQSMGSQRVGHHWRDLAAAAAGHHHGGRDRVEGKVIKIGTFVEVSGWDVWCFTFLYGGSDGKASAYNAGDLGLIPGSERSPGEGNGNPLQYSCLENPMDRGAWWATVHGVAKSQTRLSNFTFSFQNHQKLRQKWSKCQWVISTVKGSEWASLMTYDSSWGVLGGERKSRVWKWQRRARRTSSSFKPRVRAVGGNTAPTLLQAVTSGESLLRARKWKDCSEKRLGT